MSSSDGETGTERTAVRTYVPEYQKEAWATAADDLDMSLSEFVRTMTQAGRRVFDQDAVDDENLRDASAAGAGSKENGEHVAKLDGSEPGSGAVTPGVEAVETVLLEALREEPRTYEELVDHVLGDVRESVGEEVGDALQSLQTDNRVTHDPRAGAYTVVDDE